MKLKYFKKPLFWVYTLTLTILVTGKSPYDKFYFGTFLSVLMAYILSFLTYKVLNFINEKNGYIKFILSILLVFIVLIFLLMGTYILFKILEL